MPCHLAGYRMLQLAIFVFILIEKLREKGGKEGGE